MKKALITGITGQDGSYLAPLLLDKGYEVHAIVRRTSNDPTARLNDLFSGRKVQFYDGNLRDLNCISSIIKDVNPDEIYNLAAQSHVGVSFKCPDETWDINYYGVGRVVNEALKINPNVRLYQASTSEMFGNSPAPQNEHTKFNPQSPYAEAKCAAHQDFIVGIREKRGAYLCSGILFNHESPRRGKQFVTRKITHSLAKIAAGKQDTLELGNLDAVRDWGHAEDYVNAMHLILQEEQPSDFVIASGEAHSVREFVCLASAHFNYEIEWQGEGVNEKGFDKRSGRLLVTVNPSFYRPAEVNYLQGDPSRAKKILKWVPKYDFKTLVAQMTDSDKKLIEKGC